MDRRTFLLSSAGLAVAACAGPQPGQAMQALCDTAYDAYMRASPILCTTFGVDKDQYAEQKSKLEGDTPEERAAYQELLQTSLAGLARIDRAQLSGMDRTNYDTLNWEWSTLLSGVTDFPYGVKSPSQPPSPYVLSHMTGVAQSLPDFFDSNHTIATQEDAEAYLARLERYAAVMESETGHFHEDVAAGARPPSFVLRRAIDVFTGWRTTPEDFNLLVASLVRRTAEANIEGDWSGRAKAILSTKIHPALDGQIAALQAELGQANDDAGIWRLPNGEAFYEYRVRMCTSTEQTPTEIHALGLEKIDELGTLADQLLRAQGLTRGSVGERMAALFADPRFIAPNTEAGRESVLAAARNKVAQI